VYADPLKHNIEKGKRKGQARPRYLEIFRFLRNQNVKVALFFVEHVWYMNWVFSSSFSGSVGLLEKKKKKKEKRKKEVANREKERNKMKNAK
jgi:hypothetical protein